jgi:hypothetical protein
LLLCGDKILQTKNISIILIGEGLEVNDDDNPVFKGLGVMDEVGLGISFSSPGDDHHNHSSQY